MALLDENRPNLNFRERNQVEISLKYKGYIERQQKSIEEFLKLEKKKLSKDIDYNEISALRLEARQKLNNFKPENLGQASRISGVSPADIEVLIIYLEQKGR